MLPTCPDRPSASLLCAARLFLLIFCCSANGRFAPLSPQFNAGLLGLEPIGQFVGGTLGRRLAFSKDRWPLELSVLDLAGIEAMAMEWDDGVEIPGGRESRKAGSDCSSFFPSRLARKVGQRESCRCVGSQLALRESVNVDGFCRSAMVREHGNSQQDGQVNEKRTIVSTDRICCSPFPSKVTADPLFYASYHCFSQQIPFFLVGKLENRKMGYIGIANEYCTKTRQNTPFQCALRNHSSWEMPKYWINNIK